MGRECMCVYALFQVPRMLARESAHGVYMRMIFVRNIIANKTHSYLDWERR